MFEKEAEEYTKERAKELDINDCCLAYYAMQRAYQKGAEFGYNKANEWHDLRKDPNDLPNGYRVVLNQVGMATNYDPTRGFLGLGGVGVIAWREIPIFEKE